MISCLCVTHERREFMPWLEHQFLKQHRDATGLGQMWPTNSAGAELIIVDSSAVPWESEFAIVHHAPAMPGIAAKRTLALALSTRPFITWFDDDDWQSPVKCLQAEKLWDPDEPMAGDLCAIGSRHAQMYSVVAQKCGLYESNYEPIIFNSSVYRKSAVPQSFSEHHVVGEDTEWHERWLRSRPTYLTAGFSLHAWLCHGKNITNKANARFFENRCDVPFDDCERLYLKAMFG